MSELRAACYGRDPERDGWPSVSVVLPVRNEAPDLERAVTSVLAQHYPGCLDLCIAVAPSDDDTESIARRLADRNDHVTVVANDAGNTPSGLNAAIRATAADVVVRVDGRATLSEGYIARAVDTMCRTGAVNVGGVQAARGETRFEDIVAAVMTSKLGTGGARFHVGGAPGPVDTVYLGVFDRAAGESVGWFDESLLRNQDYELNMRLRAAGGVVWFDPELSASYRPRGSLRALGRQYHDYGYWKGEVLLREPTSLRARQLIPPVVVGSVAAAALLGLRRPRAWFVPAAYVATLVFAAPRRSFPAGAAALGVIHGAWSAGLARRVAEVAVRRIRALVAGRAA